MATKLECFILHRSEVVLTLALLYSHALSTEKHIFHKFLTRQIAHRSHHSAPVILSLFTPIKKRTAKHRASRNEYPQLCSLTTLAMSRSPLSEKQSRALWEVLGRTVIVTVQHFPSTSCCMPAEIPAQVPHLPDPASPLAVPRCWSSTVLDTSYPGNPCSCCGELCRCCVLQWRRCLKRALVLLWNPSLTRLL